MYKAPVGQNLLNLSTSLKTTCGVVAEPAFVRTSCVEGFVGRKAFLEFIQERATDSERRMQCRGKHNAAGSCNLGFVFSLNSVRAPMKPSWDLIRYLKAP